MLTIELGTVTIPVSAPHHSQMCNLLFRQPSLRFIGTASKVLTSSNYLLLNHASSHTITFIQSSKVHDFFSLTPCIPVFFCLGASCSLFVFCATFHFFSCTLFSRQITLSFLSWSFQKSMSLTVCFSFSTFQTNHHSLHSS